MNKIQQMLSENIITIVGMSMQKGSFSNDVCKNIITYGYKGKIQIVNPKGGYAYGIEVKKDISELNEFGLTLIFLNKNKVCFTVEQIAKCGGKNFVIYSSGFEKNDEEVNALYNVIQRYYLNVVGPNCMGIMDTHRKLYASNWMYSEKSGDIALVSQSGAYGMILSHFAKTRELFLSKFFSIGDCLTIDFEDALNYLYDDNKTKFIVLYVEGIKNGRAFLEVLKKVCVRKRVIILKSGRTEKGMESAATHSGACKMDYDTFISVCHNAGAIIANDAEELMDILYLYHFYEKISNHDIVVMSSSGGPCTVAADYINANNLKLEQFNEELKNKLQEILPAFASVNNPIDVTTAASASQSYDALNAVIKDGKYRIIILMVFTDFLSDEFVKSINAAKKDIVICITLDNPKFYKEFERLNIPVFFSIRRAINALEKVINGSKETVQYNNKLKLPGLCIPELTHVTRGVLNEERTKAILRQAGLMIGNEALISNEEELCLQWEKLRKPVCVKLIADNIYHKTDVGGVIKNVIDLNVAKKILTQWKQDFSSTVKLLISEMRDNECQILLNIKKNPSFGYILSIGIGGILVEKINSKSLCIIPDTVDELSDFLENSKIGFLLNQFRGRYKIDKNIMIDYICRLISLVKAYSSIDEIELNPILIQNNELYIADAIMVIK